MKERGGARGVGGPMMTDVSAWEPMARGGRSPHSGLLAWLARYVKQLLLIWSPQSRAFGGLVRRPVRPSAGASGPGTELGEAWSPREARGRPGRRAFGAARSPVCVSQKSGLHGERVGPARGSP